MINRQVTAGYKRKVNEFVEAQNDLSYTWEDLYGQQATGIGYWQYVARVRVGF
jgi:hypothetical protein